MRVARREFLRLAGALVVLAPRAAAQERRAGVAVIGGGFGGVAAALAALRQGARVVLTEETDWIGGQVTSQAVPPDEHPWIETHGRTRAYRQYRLAIREYYPKGANKIPRTAVFNAFFTAGVVGNSAANCAVFD